MGALLMRVYLPECTFWSSLCSAIASIVLALCALLMPHLENIGWHVWLRAVIITVNTVGNVLEWKNEAFYDESMSSEVVLLRVLMLTTIGGLWACKTLQTPRHELYVVVLFELSLCLQASIAHSTAPADGAIALLWGSYVVPFLVGYLLVCKQPRLQIELASLEAMVAETAREQEERLQSLSQELAETQQHLMANERYKSILRDYQSFLTVRRPGSRRR